MLHPPYTDHQVPVYATRLRGIASLTVAGALCLGLTACTPPQEDAFRLEDYNIVVLVVDTLGANHVGAYNPSLDHTPRMDAFAASGTRFGRAYSTAPWTQPSVASLITSRMPSGHGVHNIRDVLEANQRTLAELLRERGYATGGVISHHLIGAQLGYDQGFDSYDESAVEGHTGQSSEKVTDSAIRYVDGHLDSRFFLFAHYFDPHYYYHHHPQFDRTSSYRGPLAEVEDIWEVREQRPRLQNEDVEFLRDRHLEEISFVDHHVGRLLDHLSRSGLDDSTIVVLVADHGEEFMEHGWIGHTRTLFEELIHVPMVLRIPGRTIPAVVDTPVSILDVLPTLLSLSETAFDDGGWDGESLLPYLTASASRPEARGIFAEVSFLPPSTRQWEKRAFKTALIQGEAKIVHDRLDDSWTLYRLDIDPRERAPITGEPTIFEEMAQRLTRWEKERDLPDEFSMPAPDDISEEELERLRSLGYVQ